MAKTNKVNKTDKAKNKRHFWKDFKAELKKVVWPTPKQLINNTVAVVTIVLITAAIVFVLDLDRNIFHYFFYINIRYKHKRVEYKIKKT